MGGMDFFAMLKNRLDLFVIGWFLPLAHVGIYGAIVELTGAMRRMRSAFDPILMPLVQHVHLKGERSHLAENLALALRWLLVPALWMLGLLAIFPEAFLLVFGRSFTQGSVALAVLAAGTFVFVTLGLVESALAITGFAYVTLGNWVSLTLLNFGLLVLFVPRWGIVGAAAATAIALTVISVWRLAQGRRRLGVLPFHRAQKKPLAAFLAAAAVAVIARRFVPASFPALVALGLAYSALFAALLWRLGLEPQDREILAKVRERVRRWSPSDAAVPV